MWRNYSVARIGTQAASFKLENVEVARVSRNKDDIASTWDVDAGAVEDVGEHEKLDENWEGMRLVGGWMG